MNLKHILLKENNTSKILKHLRSIVNVNSNNVTHSNSHSVITVSFHIPTPTTTM